MLNVSPLMRAANSSAFRFAAMHACACRSTRSPSRLPNDELTSLYLRRSAEMNA